jgi:hypothetical protein
MATTRSFQAMLNEYLPNDLLKEELVKRDWFLTNVEKDNGWKGGPLIVPFRGQQSSSIAMGGLTASNDISEDKYVRGEVSDYVEAWGSLIFNHRDLMDHSGRVKEDSFLKVLPDIVDDFMGHMKMVVSVQLGTGPEFSDVADDTNHATGVSVVSKIDRYQLDMKVILDDDDTAAAAYYVIAIDVNGGAAGTDQGSVTLSATRGGAAADISAYTVAQNAKLYTDGANTTSFQSLESALLSAANGGSANLYGVSKLAYPYLQAVNVDGGAISATNILSELFDAYTEVRQKAKGGRANTFLMSYKNLGSVMKLIEDRSSAHAHFIVAQPDRNASIYGWDEITITTVKGTLKVVGIQEWSDDTIAIVDRSAMKFYSNGFFKKRKNPDGDEYFEVRNTTGYQYIVDVCLFGELVVHAPGHCGIIYNIDY